MWSDPQNVLAIINIGVMGFFTFLVWRATLNGAKAAKATYQLSERLMKLEGEERKAIKKQYLNNVILNLMEAKDAISQQAIRLNVNALKKMPMNHGLTDEQLAIYFTEGEIVIIDYPWSSLGVYMTYWMDEEGGFYESFNMDEVEIIRVESEGMAETLEETIDKLLRSTS